MMSWDSEALWLKAKLYMDRANSFDTGDPLFAFWSALSLEHLCRAALTKVHPALNADPREDTNLLYGFGFQVTGQPKSLPIHSVYIRLAKIVPDFGKLERELCDFLSLLRNQELHTGDLAFDNLKVSKWLPRYYSVVEVLCKSLGKELDALFDANVAESATKLIATLTRDIESAAKGKISAHRKAFDDKDANEQAKLRAEAAVATATAPHGSTAAKCPACGTHGLLRGERIKDLQAVYEDFELTVDEQFLAVEFTCLACALHLRNVEEVSYADIEPRFSQKRVTSLHELFEPDYDYEYDNM